MEPLGQVIEDFINNLPKGGSVDISYIKEKVRGKYTTMELIDAANYLIEKRLVFYNDKSKECITSDNKSITGYGTKNERRIF